MGIPEDAKGLLLLRLCLSSREKNADCEKQAWLRWHATIPAEIRQIVHHFPERQWHMLSFLARCGEAAYDLTAANPALAFALASNWVYHCPPVRRPPRAARALLQRGKKQRDVLVWLVFPGTKAARKMLVKVIRNASGSQLSFIFVKACVTPPRSRRWRTFLA